jgi:hypothetical protein
VWQYIADVVAAVAADALVTTCFETGLESDWVLPHIPIIQMIKKIIMISTIFAFQSWDKTEIIESDVATLQIKIQFFECEKRPFNCLSPRYRILFFFLYLLPSVFLGFFLS